MATKPEIFKTPSLSERASQLMREMKWVLFAILGAALLLMLLSYDTKDPAFNHVSSQQITIHNWVGALGAWVADIMLYIFGLSAYWWVVLCGSIIWFGYRRFLHLSLFSTKERGDIQIEESRDKFLFRAGFAVLLFASMGLEARHMAGWTSNLPYKAGGVLGNMLAGGLTLVVGQVFTTLLLLFLFCAGLSWFFNFSWLSVCEQIGADIEHAYAAIMGYFSAKEDEKVGEVVAAHREKIVEEEKQRIETAPPVIIAPPAPPVVQSERVQKEKQVSLFSDMNNTTLPELSLLDPADAHQETVSTETLEFTSRLIEKKLRDFNVEVKVVAAYPGPVVTRYEIEPATGVKGSQIVNLAKDLARSFSMTSIRVVETIPGKTYMALELPNPKRQIVRLSEIIGSQLFFDSNSPLSVALGKDIGGKPVVADIAKMPHLLVAGTTGSGKSVGINTMILSLLYKAEPKDVRLILIDPKMLEMSVYEGIPHLLCPVVTDMRQAAHALNWAVGEMEKRYKLMSKLGVRNLAGYNKKIDDATAKEEHVPNPFSLTPDAPEPLGRLPNIVIVIDELADLMMVVGKKIEELIARIAQKARAAGIHLILATQRPSVDVITGLIKANVPTRMAFQVSSKIDSRTILDQQGAEALLGQGDMLYLPSGLGMPTRVHGAFASDDEVHRVVENLKLNGEPDYIDEILNGGTEGDGEFGDSESGAEEADVLYDQAVALVIKSRRASISYVQRELRIGYNRSARLLDQMEKSGVVSSMQSNGNREVLAPSHE
ncbi:DNA translocase FtsK [Ephemeroptericola cinctiostellae]|uniref:DNA translocase FtsK n=1 Tax=Ephemeroptericola cinctiostellae TaxID=2268024 RepID=A0A345DAZ3_9BURK|nr:DNA translocase FtsK [Ephemeroptericola cinctiostellae]AXF85531.1 DNA translocase FtsK [Ephemeroptericola cinctiostellae]